MPRRAPRHAVRATVAGITALGTLTGCITGERPTLIDRPSVDDPAARAVLDRLDTSSTTEFTATYEITPTLTGQPTPATVVQSGTRRRVSIGDVDFISDGTMTRTCIRDDGDCVDFLDDARVSDLNITHRFWGDAFRARLELDASRRIGFSEASDQLIAGHPAACVDIPIPSTSQLSGTVQYCALDAGPLARYIGADVRIELVEFSATADGIDP
ncbi:MAG TPA: hypothetical protein VK917_04615 [Ilumatobacter sp.]|nr:hypothetical protein [Ilumatobacter sp.]